MFSVLSVNQGFVYDSESFEKLEEFTYPTEGWGLTHDGDNLIMSDGSDSLFFLDPETFEEVKRISVLLMPPNELKIQIDEYLSSPSPNAIS